MQENSVSRLLDGLKEGDAADIQRLWDRYFHRLVGLAGSRLPGHTRRAYDEEDIALSAFQSFCDRAGRGQFPSLSDRDDLWRLLSTITTRKVIATIRHETRLKRGGGLVVGESAVANEEDATGGGLTQYLSREPTPEAAIHFADAYERLFARLDDPTLKSVAQLRLEGRSSEEIAAELGTTRRTVDRKLALVRAIWEEEAPE
jgi:DNA-directed RNA polymerase specialized sigma24 family protein